MITFQAWTRDRRVAVFVISPCTNGMSGWALHSATYDPSKGETTQSVSWSFLGAAHDVIPLIQCPLLSMLAKDIASSQETTTLLSLMEQLVQTTKAIQASMS